MNSTYKILLYGFAISFVGALPPGTMTITATFISAKQGLTAGLTYGLGSVIAEALVITLLLRTIKYISRWNNIYFLLQVFATIFLVAITIGCFYLAYSDSKINFIDNSYQLQPFSSGFIISILNPLHIPFWLGWSAVLMKKNVLQPGLANYSSYIIGIAAGSMLNFMLYVSGGKYILNNFARHQQLIVLITGIILLVTTFMHIRKLTLTKAVIVIRE